MKWLMLRGFWDVNNKHNIQNKLDMWTSFFESVVGDDKGYVWFKSKGYKTNAFHYSKNVEVFMSHQKEVGYNIPWEKYDIVFARGGHPEYVPILRKCKNAYKIRYSAGKRIYPEKDIHYDLILVDSDAQKKKVLKKFPKANIKIFFKPAANHFKPMDVEKKYDVGFVAVHPKDKRKRVAWVYKTVPKHLKVLQLGHKPKRLKVPKNVTVKHVKSDKMVKMINQCKVIICPYTSADSGPRIIPEALACGVPVVCRDSVNFDKDSYICVWVTGKKTFWPDVEEMLKLNLKCVSEAYKIVSSIEVAVSHLRRLIDG